MGSIINYLYKKYSDEDNKHGIQIHAWHTFIKTIIKIYREI